MPKVSRISKHSVSTPLTIADLPSVLASWSQAVRDFHTLHGVLSETIASRQSANGTKPATQYSLCELKKVRDTMAQEIISLINELDNSGDLSPESASLTISRLRSHTIRLEKEAERIKRALWLSSLGAS
ncbi:hypothetical protein GK091_22280 [Spirosoma agri]|uniref:Uncharacterized protein n=1 Tax=Spirosoma agri TaxID=1987381 RepID=A0A6M0IPZ9_9BACT|nr:hypothetical protein [Spirosoma agri]NEU69625.1 hypothetical protein [Spirosoma agri]